MSKISKYSFTLNVNQVVFQKLHKLHEERFPNAEFDSFVEYVLATFVIDNTDKPSTDQVAKRLKDRVLWDGINSCLVVVPTPAGYYENEPVWAADDDDNAIAYGDGKVTITDDDDDDEDYPIFDSN